MLEKKDEPIEELRRRALLSRNVVETQFADFGLIEVSLQSVPFPNRHVWAMAHDEQIHVDLEDWNDKTEWDNAVGRLAVRDVAICTEIIVKWLSGSSVEDCRQIVDKAANTN